MAAPSGIKWGSIYGGYGRIGIYTKLTTTSTKASLNVQVWVWTKYSCSDSNNTLYYNVGTNITSATTSQGSVNINHTVASGEGWSTSNQTRILNKTYTDVYTLGTTSKTYKVYASLKDVDRVGAIMYANTSYTVPALASYTVKYNANGGTGAPANQTKWYGKDLALSSTKPTRTGYTFGGWATSSTATVATYKPSSTYTANASVTLYAVWKINTYTIKYNANGGTGTPANQTKTYGKALTLSTTKPTRASVEDDMGTLTEYSFQGWATSSTATSPTYKSGASYTANASATLYAVWSTTVSLNLFDVIYNSNGGSYVAPQIKTKGVDLTLRDTVPIKNGYTFGGWALSADVTDAADASYKPNSTYNIDEDIILYAVWIPWTHTVTFDANGGTGNVPEDFVKTTGVDVLVPESILSKDGCIFECWSTSNDDSIGIKYYAGDGYAGIQNGGIVKLYAVWDEKKVTINLKERYCEATAFIEDNNSGSAYFKNNGTVYAFEFIEDDTFSLDGSVFHFAELIER